MVNQPLSAPSSELREYYLRSRTTCIAGSEESAVLLRDGVVGYPRAVATIVREDGGDGHGALLEANHLSDLVLRGNREGCLSGKYILECPRLNAL